MSTMGTMSTMSTMGILAGRSPIAGYIIESKKVNKEWKRVISLRGDSTTHILQNIEEGERFYFHVIARTAILQSKPSEESELVHVRQKIEMVDIKLLCSETISTKAGQDIIIEALINGKPKPSINWTKEDIDLKQLEDERMPIETMANISRIIIRSCRRSDAGCYLLKAENSSGSNSTCVKVKVLDIPGMPQLPIKFLNVHADKLNLTWNEPKEDGGAPITNYVIERQETLRPTWALGSGSVIGTEIIIIHLIKDHEYEFRISAENKYGIGLGIVSESVVAKNPYTSPSACDPPIVSNPTVDKMTVSWKLPENDGGKPITGYYLEKRETKSVLWSKVNRQPIRVRSLKVFNLTENMEYEFRVFAENIAGISKPSKASRPAIATDPKYPPAPPGFPKLEDMTKNSASSIWSKPAYDGGSPITGYNIEISSPESPDVFHKVANTKNTKFIVNLLEEGREYKMRVKACNKIGESEPSDLPQNVIPKDILEPPSFILGENLTKTVVVRAGNPIKLNCLVQGRPAPKLSWNKFDGELNFNRVEIKFSDWDTSIIIQECNRDDSGKYMLNMANSSGQKTATISVKVQDTPGQMNNLLIKDMTSN